MAKRYTRPMIVFEDVSCVLASGRLKKVVLQEASLSLPGNEHLAVLGHEGSGKSTLVRLLAGSTLPSSGSIKRYSRVSFPVGFGGGYRKSLSAYENIAHVAHLYGADAEEVVNFVSRLSGIDGALDEEYGNLPPHLKVRLAYAVSYAIPFDTYVIDNKVALGDSEFRGRCERVFEARMQDSGFILTTSLPRYARRFCRRAAILHQGRLELYDDMDRAIWDFERLERAPVSAGLVQDYLPGADAAAEAAE